MSEHSEISEHEIRVYRLLKGHAERWYTAREIGQQAMVNPRTARTHVAKLVELGLADCAEVFPGHRYQWIGRRNPQSDEYIQRLEQAEAAFMIGVQ